MTLKELKRASKAAYKRPSGICILCDAEMEYNPVIGWYVRKDGEGGGCGAQFETGSVHHVLDNGRRSHQFAGSDIVTAFRG